MASQAETLCPEPLLLENGVRGSRLERPALDRLREQARLGACAAVILLSPERLARRDPPPWVLLAEGKKGGGRVICLAHPCGDAPHGPLGAPRQGRRAEAARRQLTERPRRGRVPKARTAAWMPGASRMYGDRSPPKQAGMPPRVAIHPAQADVVRALGGWVRHAQRPTRHLVQRFNAPPLPTRPGRNHGGHAASVRRLLPKMLDTGHRS